MSPPKILAWILAATCLLSPCRGEPAAPTLEEQLARARDDKDPAAIAELCRRQLEHSPADAGLLREMFQAQIDLKDPDRAAATLARLEKTGAPPAELAELRGDLARAADHPLDEALAAWKDALAKKPANASALLAKIADALDAAGSWPEAAAALRAYFKTNPNHAARTARLAVCLLNAGHADEADQPALAASRLDPADETVKALAPMFDRLRPLLPAWRKLAAPAQRFDRARLLYRVGAYEAAYRTLDPESPRLADRLLRAQCLWKLDRPADAAVLRIAQIADPTWFDDDPRCRRLRAPDEPADSAGLARAFAARAMVLLEGNQPILALEDAQRAAGAEQQSGRPTADVQVVLAATLLRNDRPAEALAAARRATAIDPRNPDGWALAGRLAQERADFPAAIENLTRALTLREDGGWLRRRETCLRALGRNPEADRDSQRAGQLKS